MERGEARRGEAQGLDWRGGGFAGLRLGRQTDRQAGGAEKRRGGRRGGETFRTKWAMLNKSWWACVRAACAQRVAEVRIPRGKDYSRMSQTDGDDDEDDEVNECAFLLYWVSTRVQYK